MKTNILHISDLHYQPDWHEEINLISKHFFEDLQAQVEQYEDLYLIFSGDLVNAGSDAASYISFADNIANGLDDIGIHYNNRICVPGNHDVSRLALEEKLLPHNATLDSIKNETLFNNQVAIMDEMFLRDKFINYINYEKEFAKYTTCTTNLGGQGWGLTDQIGVYCLNSALCSTGGMTSKDDPKRTDYKRLHINTREIHKWVAKSKHKYRILVTHHPFDWLQTQAKDEVAALTQENFDLVVSGHIHRGSAGTLAQPAGGFVDCSAPPLFTRKDAPNLGYTFITIDLNDYSTEVSYRQWSNHARRFVSGTAIAGNDEGKLNFDKAGTSVLSQQPVGRHIGKESNTETLLQNDLDDALQCHASQKRIWVDRELSTKSDIHKDKVGEEVVSLSSFSKNIETCVIKSPKEFGLTCLCKYLALRHYLNSGKSSLAITIDATDVATHRQGVLKDIADRCAYFGYTEDSLGAIIIDNWVTDSRRQKLLRILLESYPGKKFIIAEGFDESASILDSLYFEEKEQFTCYYLKPLSRANIREITTQYAEDLLDLDDEVLTNKIVSDIDALNMHRTPLNCLLLLKLAEQSFDESPVNRTEIISRVMWLLFTQFDSIPTYANRPDRTDCEYALGYFSEWMIKNTVHKFLRDDFSRKISEYSRKQKIAIDSQILFAILVGAGIFLRRGQHYEFRFNYWLYYFAAHRMHHNPEFAEYILSDARYASMPEIVEFYTGLDRRRSDAVIALTADLKEMDRLFQDRTRIPIEFDPYRHAEWIPNPESIEAMKRDVGEGAAESQLPSTVKDAIADGYYDPSKPYRQEIAQFMTESTLIQMVQAMRGAARALRNCDHVDPDIKSELLESVMLCWVRVCQTIAILSPVLAAHGKAGYEGMNFILAGGLDSIDEDKRWEELMKVITDNVLRWFHEDLFSKKLGLLMSSFLEEDNLQLSKFLLLCVMVKQRPPGWKEEVEKFVISEHKNSFYLARMLEALSHEYKLGFVTEHDRPHLRRLASIALARHSTGVKKPNKKLMEKAEQHFDNIVRD